MRTLNDYFLFGGTFVTFAASDTGAGVAVVPDGGEVVGLVLNTHAILDANSTIDIVVNTVDTGSNFVTSSTLADETGEVLAVVGAKVYVNAGDALTAITNGEQTTTTTNPDITWIIRR